MAKNSFEKIPFNNFTLTVIVVLSLLFGGCEQYLAGLNFINDHASDHANDHAH